MAKTNLNVSCAQHERNKEANDEIHRWAGAGRYNIQGCRTHVGPVAKSGVHSDNLEQPTGWARFSIAKA